MDISQRGGMQNSLPPLGLVDISLEAKDRKREGPVPSYIGAGLLTSVTLLLPNEGVEFMLCRVQTLVSGFSHRGGGLVKYFNLARWMSKMTWFYLDAVFPVRGMMPSSSALLHCWVITTFTP